MEDFPAYSFVDELKGPTELGIRRDGSFGAVANAMAGINYYFDAIGFGNSTAYAAVKGGPYGNQKPLGLRFFANTGQTCSNGAPMHEYISTIPTGNLMGKRVTEELRQMRFPGLNQGFPPLQGLAPGILEDAISATNPIPMLKAVQGGYPKCKKLRAQVGSNEAPYIRSRLPPHTVWIKDKDLEIGRDGVPFQTRWVLDKWISQKEWDCTPKTEAPKKTEKTEGFENQQDKGQLYATILLGILGVSLLLYARV
jgi:hypothetical protein